jgi:hypothetical protein
MDRSLSRCNRVTPPGAAPFLRTCRGQRVRRRDCPPMPIADPTPVALRDIVTLLAAHTNPRGPAPDRGCRKPCSSIRCSPSELCRPGRRRGVGRYPITLERLTAMMCLLARNAGRDLEGASERATWGATSDPMERAHARHSRLARDAARAIVAAAGCLRECIASSERAQKRAANEDDHFESAAARPAVIRSKMTILPFELVQTRLQSEGFSRTRTDVNR